LETHTPGEQAHRQGRGVLLKFRLATFAKLPLTTALIGGRILQQSNYQRLLILQLVFINGTGASVLGKE
jgi:hypothetical protein